MSVVPAGLDSVTTNGLPGGEIEAAGTVCNLGTLDIAHYIWLATAGRARALAAHGFECQVGFPAIIPSDSEVGSDLLNRGWLQCLCHILIFSLARGDVHRFK